LGGIRQAILMRFLFHILLVFGFLNAQTFIKGKLINEKNEGIPFASVGSVKLNAGVLSDENGSFDLELSVYNETDSIKLFAIGYKERYISILELKMGSSNELRLWEEGKILEEVEVSAKKLYRKKLGVVKYDKSNCSGFVGIGTNWKGVETAIRIPNSNKQLMKLMDFQFYIIKNTLKDSLMFRLNIYSSNEFFPTQNILKRSIIFKTAVKQGEVSLDLSAHDIRAYDDFFVSLECLMEQVDIKDFCFAGENKEPSYIREGVFRKWKKVKGGGGAFNVSVLCQKK
jgi:hypothetical protein